VFLYFSQHFDLLILSLLNSRSKFGTRTKLQSEKCNYKRLNIYLTLYGCMSVRFFCRFLMNKWICPWRYVMKTMGRYNCTSSMWTVSLSLRLLRPRYPWDRSLSVRRPTAAENIVPQITWYCNTPHLSMHLVINSEEEGKSCTILFLFSSLFPSLLFLHEMFSLIKTYLCAESVLEGQV